MPHINTPHPYDAVLGQRLIQPSPNSVVLGGLDRIQQRLNSDSETERVAALHAAQHYGTAGLRLIVKALDHPTLACRKAAYSILRQQDDPQIQQQIQAISPYPFFECLNTLTGHTAGITAIALSADGQLGVSSDRHYQIKVWDLNAGEEILSVQDSKLIFSITLDLEYSVFITKYKDQTYTLWSLRNGLPLEYPPWEDSADIPVRHISSVTLTTNQHLISSSQNTIRIWDLQQGREVNVLRGHTSLVTAVSSSIDYPLIASGSEDKTIRLWGLV